MNWPDALYQPLADGPLRLEPLAEAHREGLRAACAADPDIWDIYVHNYAGAAFDPQFDRMLAAPPARCVYAVFEGEALVGMTAWIAHGEPGWSIEIGNTYLAPSVRGTGLNGRIKHLMLNHAFACGLARVAFRVDARNVRSQAALAKLGATREGVMRAERRTWTGFVRDSVVFSILRSEWQEAGA